MPGVETAVVAAGKAVAERAMREWLAARAARKERSAELKDLIQSGFRDRLAPRKFGNQLEGMALAVESRLRDLVEQEYRGLDEQARSAVLLEVVETLRAADLSDAALFESDADPAKLAQRVLAGVPAPRLGTAEDALYAVLLAECVDCLVGMMQQLPQYLPRAATESLTRLSGLAEGMERVLARLPARSLEAPEGTQDDAAFERLYLSFVSRTLDQVELFGIPVENYRPRTSLSVAYISLSATTGERRAQRPADRLMVASLTERHEPQLASRRIESVLGRSRLTLLRGEAGSGKSTLLRWLAISAARGDLSGDLSGWNGAVPLMIKLRSHADGRLPAPEDFLCDVAQEVSGRKPRGWVARVLESGRGLLLVDGVDELPVRLRGAVRDWLSRLLAAYPAMKVVVTARPTAADARWLADEGFTAAMLEPMTPQDLRELVRQWHVAMRDCPSLPCGAEELPGYEGALLARMESSPHLRLLAATPLLAAMLCALNLDRRTQLPRSRMGLYEAVLALLLDRRDAERRIDDQVTLDPDQKVWILRDLAWRLVSMGRSELSKATALRRIEQKLELMTRMPYSAADVLDHLLRRSGVLREPVPGRVDFAHRTVQEYLAAAQLVEDEDVEAAVERAHLDQWREVVIMTAGHATGGLRKELLAGLLDRAGQGGRHARRLRLLVAACLETIKEIPLELKDRIEACLREVIPPRTDDEARMLAAAGEEILLRLPADLSALTEKRAAMVVRTAWMINGTGALDQLAAYAPDPRRKVQVEVREGWRYFEPRGYAQCVLSRAANTSVVIDDLRLLRGLKHLPRTTSLAVEAESPTTDLRFLRDLPKVEDLSFNEIDTDDLHEVGRLYRLERLWLKQAVRRTMSLDALERLPRLRDLTLWNADLRDLTFLDRLPRLHRLGLTLPGPERDVDLAPLARQTELAQVSLKGRGTPVDPATFSGMPHLIGLALDDIADPARVLAAHPRVTTVSLLRADLEDLSVLSPFELDHLHLNRCAGISDLSALGDQPDLRILRLQWVPVADLGPLSGMDRLDFLDLTGCVRIEDLSSLATLTRLKDVILRGVADGIDLAPLAGKPGLTIYLNADQKVVNENLVRRTARIRRA